MAYIEVNDLTGNPLGPIWDTVAGGLAACTGVDIVEITNSSTYVVGALSIPFDGVTLRGKAGETPTLQRTLDILSLNGKDDVTIENLIFDVASGINRKAISTPSVSDRFLIKDCTFINSTAVTGTGIYCNAGITTRVDIQGCSFQDLGVGMLINLSPTQVYVTDCTSRNVGIFYQSNGSGMVINNVDHEGGPLIVNALWRNDDLVPEVINCIAYGTPGAFSSMMELNLVSNTHPNARIYHNLLIDDGTGVKIGIKGVWAGVVTEPAPLVKNNTIEGFPTSVDARASMVFDNNMIDGAAIGGVVPLNAVAGPAVYVDPVAHDWQHGAGDPGIDSGVDVGVTEDILGLSRPQGAGVDLGPYEYLPPHQKGAVGVFATGTGATIRLLEVLEPSPETEEV